MADCRHNTSGYTGRDLEVKRTSRNGAADMLR